MTPKSSAIKVISYDLCQPNDIWPILFSHPNLAKPHDDENHWFWIIKISSPAFQVSHGGYGIVFRVRISLFVTASLSASETTSPAHIQSRVTKGSSRYFLLLIRVNLSITDLLLGRMHQTPTGQEANRQPLHTFSFISGRTYFKAHRRSRALRTKPPKGQHAIPTPNQFYSLRSSCIRHFCYV